MADILTPRQRSERMARVRGRGNRSTEVALARAFRLNGVSGWRRHVRLRLQTAGATLAGGSRPSPFVRPDFVFPTPRIAVFVDGCFWHACPLHGTRPVGNASFWAVKLEANRRRDRLTTASLRRAGWVVVRVWEHDVKKRLDSCVRRVQRALDGRGSRGR